ncbi:MAG: uracil-DNA glycosylase, partial [Gammaproteobacteria bacterium]|nr:uracil-DNA glycosylase [Gammaproteobacteria bacterium]
MKILQQMGIRRWRRRELGDSAECEQVAANHPQEAQASALMEKPIVPQKPSQIDLEAHSEKPGAPLRSIDHTISEPVKTDDTATPTADRSGTVNIEFCSWQELEQLLKSGAICQSCKQQKSIFGSGNKSADWVIVIDAPSAQDIQNGQLLSGREGQLFDAILQSIGVGRSGIYICPARKCRSDANSHPQAECGKLLHRQLSLINPKVVLAMGALAAQTVLRTNDDMQRIDGQEHRLSGNGASVVATHSLHE